MIVGFNITSEDVILSSDGCYNQEVEIDHSSMINSGYLSNQYHVEVGTEVSNVALPQSYSFTAKIEVDDGAGGIVEHLTEIWVNFISDIG